MCAREISIAGNLDIFQALSLAEFAETFDFPVNDFAPPPTPPVHVPNASNVTIAGVTLITRNLTVHHGEVIIGNATVPLPATLWLFVTGVAMLARRHLT